MIIFSLYIVYIAGTNLLVKGGSIFKADQCAEKPSSKGCQSVSQILYFHYNRWAEINTKGLYLGNYSKVSIYIGFLGIFGIVWQGFLGIPFKCTIVKPD